MTILHFENLPLDLSPQLGITAAVAEVSKRGREMARLYTDETWRGVGTQPNFAREYPVIHNWLQANGSPTPQNIGDLYRTLEGRAKDSLTAPNLEEIDRIDQIDKYSLNPVRFLRIETEIHQRENDENLMKLWPKLRDALPQAVPRPHLQTVQQVKNWLSDPANQASLAQITHLDLSNLGLTTIPAEFTALQLPNLTELSLHQNRLTALPDGFLQNAHQLQELDLSGNRLAALPDGFLQNAPRLGSLSLSDNRLATLPDGFLQNAPQLLSLYLNHNLLAALPDGFLQNAPLLQFLDLGDNTLRLVLFLNRRGICATVLGIGALAYATSGFALETCTDTPGIFWGSWTSCEPTVLGAALSTAGEVAATLNTTATAIFTSRAFISTAIGGAIANRILNYVTPDENLGNRRHVCALIAGFAIQAIASYVNLGS